MATIIPVPDNPCMFQMFGRNQRVVGQYGSAASAIAAATAIVPSDAATEAGLALNGFKQCPSTCPKPRLGPIVTSIEYVDSSQDILSLVSNFFNLLFDQPLVYNGTVVYTWAANLICEGGRRER